MLTSINKDLSDDEIVNLIIKDPIKRNTELIDFIKLLDNIEPPYSIFLNSAWGAGKTVFVKQIEFVLQCNNPALKPKFDNETIQQLKETLKLEQEIKYMPIYFNAWHYDSFDNPIIPLIVEITNQTKIKLKKINVNKRNLINNIISIANDILNNLTGIQIPNINKDIVKNDYFEDFDKEIELRDKITKLISKIYKSHNENKILLIIDELDRSKPVFALNLLEKLKTLFTNKYTIVLYSINSNELAKTVSHLYGYNFDGYKYLQRFYDLAFGLSPVSSINYQNYLSRSAGFSCSNCITDTFLREFADYYSISIRDFNLCTQKLSNLKKIDITNVYYDEQIKVNAIIKSVATILLCLEISKNNYYSEIVLNYDGEKLHNILEKMTAIYDEILGYAGSLISIKEEKKKDLLIQIFNVILYNIFSANNGNDTYNSSINNENDKIIICKFTKTNFYKLIKKFFS